MKKILIFLLTTLFLVIIPVGASAKSVTKVYVNTQEVKFQVNPVVVGGTTLVQFRPIFEKLGYNVTLTKGADKGLYDVISAEKNGTTISFIIGQTQAISGGKVYYLSVPPKSINGSSMVPLRFIAEASGYNVNWNPKLNRIDITYNQAQSPANDLGDTDPVTSEDSSFEYKNAYKWGASINTVKSSQKTSPVLERTNTDGNKEVVYSSTFGGQNGRLGFTFDSSGLIEVMYLSSPSSEFINSLGTYTSCYMDLSFMYNNGSGPSDMKWNTDSISIQAYKEVYKNNNSGMTEMAMKSDELSLLAEYGSTDSSIYLMMQNTGTFSKPEYMVGLNYVKK